VSRPSSVELDQLAALVELAAAGTLRSAAESLHISEQGLRSRLIALERGLGAELYHKSRGRRRRPPLTPEGQRLLPRARAILAEAAEIDLLFREDAPPQTLDVIASQYLITYVLIEAARQFHREQSDTHVRLSARSEQAVEETLRTDVRYALGVAAPYERSAELTYRHLFSLKWSLVTPRRHALAERRTVKIAEIAGEPLILFERGSTGRQHVLEAFGRAGAAPHIVMETTNTDITLRMVEAGLGVAIVPLLDSGIVTKGRRVVTIPLGKQVRPIESGVLTRKGETLSPAATRFIELVAAVA